jgi:hypothetical protein
LRGLFRRGRSKGSKGPKGSKTQEAKRAKDRTDPTSPLSGQSPEQYAALKDPDEAPKLHDVQVTSLTSQTAHGSDLCTRGRNVWCV